MRWHPVSVRKNITDLRHPPTTLGNLWQVITSDQEVACRSLDLYGQDWKVSSKKNLKPCNVLCLLVESKKPAYAVEGVGKLWKFQVCMGQPDYSLWNFAKSSLLLVPSLFAMDSFYLCPSKKQPKSEIQNSKFKNEVLLEVFNHEKWRKDSKYH
jgi:hypothetical protein